MAAYPEARREQFLERPLPSSDDSERTILGAILLDNSVVTQAVEIFTRLSIADYMPRWSRFLMPAGRSIRS